MDELKARVEAQDAGHRGQAEDLAQRGAQRRAQAVGEAQHRDGDVRVAQRELAHGALGVDDVALDRRARRVRAVHRLGEERGIVLLGAVVVRAGLEDDLAHRVALAPARRQHVHRADDVVLVGQARAGDDRVDHQPRVDHGVDLGRLDDAPDERVRVGHAHVLGAVQLDLRRAPVDADDRLDGRVALERLREPAAPVRRQAGEQDPLGAHPNQTLRRSAEHVDELVLDGGADLVGDGLHERLVLPRLVAEGGVVGRHRGQEAELELGRQVAEHPEQAEVREGRRDREVRAARSAAAAA